MSLFQRRFSTGFVSKKQLFGFFMHGTLVHWQEMGWKQSDFKYMDLSVIAQNRICIGFHCVSYPEDTTIWQYHSHLTMFYYLHLALIIWDMLQKHKHCCTTFLTLKFIPCSIKFASLRFNEFRFIFLFICIGRMTRTARWKQNFHEFC